MAEIRVQIAHHFKLDPAQLTPGAVRLPEMITRTVSVGEEFVTEKVAFLALPSADRHVLVEAIEKQVREQTRTAQPVGAATADAVGAQHAAPASDVEEESAF